MVNFKMATNNNKPPDTSGKDETSLKFRLSKDGLAPITDHSKSMNYSRKTHDELSDDEDHGLCGKCDLEIQDLQQGYSPTAVVCDICKLHYHQECSGLSNELIQIVNKYGIHGTREIPWHCRVCKRYANQLVGEMVDLRRRQDYLEHEVKQMKSQLELCMEDQKKSSKSAESCNEDVQKVVREVLEQEKRQMNVVVSNLPEINNNSTQRTVLKATRDLFQGKLDVNQAEIENAEIIQTDKGNLVKVKLKSKQAKRTALINAKRLHNDEVYNEVYLKPDLTYEQRKKEAELRRELRQRTSAGEKNLRIVRGKIVTARPPPSQETN